MKLSLSTYNILLLLILNQFLCTILNGQDTLSEDAQISILTCDPGSELYSTFGHTGIRVVDPNQDLDIVFNYGIFDFDTPGFYTKFLRGKLDYKIGAYSFNGFLREYQTQERHVSEQVLNLNATQNQEIFSYLKTNLLPENRYYKYDFFFDNCSTRARDIFIEALEVDVSKIQTEKTYRDLLDEFLPGLVWSDFGIDLVIGAVADDKASFCHQTFLPDYLMYTIDELKIGNESLVAQQRTILDFRDARLERFTPGWFTPLKLFITLLILELLLFFLFRLKMNSWVNLYDKLWYFILGISGLLLLFMWFGTDHLATKRNWNLLWLNPLFLAMLFSKFRNTSLIILLGIFTLCCLLFWSMIPQSFHIAFAPIMAISLLKLWREKDKGLKTLEKRATV